MLKSYAMTRFPWKRFWCERGGQLITDSHGYLLDPEDSNNRYFEPKAIAFEAMQEPCLILLGEPGQGKSMALEDARKAVPDDAISIFVNLKGESDFGRIEKKIFDSAEFKSWQLSEQVLYLFLDSLDECAIRLTYLGRLLADSLTSKMALENRKNLRLCLACRTADWATGFQYLEESLGNFWQPNESDAMAKKSSLGVYELAPLRKKDVQMALELEGIDAETALEQIALRRVVSFAIKPVSFRFLLQLLKRHADLPSQQAELYKQGCLELIKEVDTERIFHPTTRTTPEQRFIIAARIAALSIFGRKRYISPKEVWEDDSLDALHLSAISGKSEVSKNQEFHVSELEIKETLSTAIFSAGGVTEFVWAHQTYAEFLAAFYLTERELSLEQRLDFILSSGDLERKVVPQLRETAAWLASFDTNIFEFLMENDPEVLLRSDVFSVDQEKKQLLVSALLEAYKREAILPHRNTFSERYKLLNHEDLAKQLEPIISDKSQKWTTRDFALDLANAVEIPELNSALLGVICDLEDVHHLRVTAARAISKTASESDRHKLKSFLLLGKLADDDDQLRGELLTMLWTADLSVEEVLSCLTPQQQNNFLGSYQIFLSQDFLKESLDVAQMYMILKWLTVEKNWVWIENRYSYSVIGDSFDKMFCKILDNLGYKDMLHQVAQFLVARGKEHGRYYYFLNKEMFFIQKIHENQKIRRGILREIVQNHLMDQDHLFSILYPVGQLNLLFPDDVLWILQQLEEEKNIKIQENWATLIEYQYRWSNENHTNQIFEVYQRNEVLREKLIGWFGPIELNSQIAQEMRNSHQNFLAHEREMKEIQRKNSIPTLKPPREVQIQKQLAQSKEEPGLWWRLLYILSYNPSDHCVYRTEEVSKMYGWQHADQATKNEVVQTAESYIRLAKSYADEWLGKNGIDYRDIAAFQAMCLLYSETGGIPELSPNVWSKWSAIIVHQGRVSIPSEDIECFNILIKSAYKYAPQAVIDAGLKLAEAASEKNEGLYFLNRMEVAWDNKLSSIFFDFLSKKTHPINTFAFIVEFLAERNFVPIHQLALEKFKNYKHKGQREYALAAGKVLLRFSLSRCWTEIWGILQKDKDWGKELLLHSQQINTSDETMPEHSIGELYCYLEELFPKNEDPDHSNETEMHDVTARDEITRLRSSILTSLRERGTLAAIQTLEQILKVLPTQENLKWVIHDAKEKYHTNQWDALTPQQILEITHQPNARQVRSLSQLLEIVVKSLQRLQQKLYGETSQVSLLWNEWAVAEASTSKTQKKYRPKSEAELSDFVKDFLDTDLKSAGIILNREVEIRRSQNAFQGERTDILVDVVLDNPQREKVGVIIEVKGCWNREVLTGLSEQLVNRYLHENPNRYGIYLVGWFFCDQWDTSHDQFQATKRLNLDIEGLKTALLEQAKNRTNQSTQVNSFVLDTRLPISNDGKDLSNTVQPTPSKKLRKKRRSLKLSA
jgi:hypothetical protein